MFMTHKIYKDLLNGTLNADRNLFNKLNIN